MGSFASQDMLAFFTFVSSVLFLCLILIVKGILRFSKGPLSKKILRYLAKIKTDELAQIRAYQKGGKQYKMKKEVNGR
jgi:hypothetical protein